MIIKLQNGDKIKIESTEKEEARRKYKEYSQLSIGQKLKRNLNIASNFLKSGPNITNFGNAVSALFGDFNPENPDLHYGEPPNVGIKDFTRILKTARVAREFIDVLSKAPKTKEFIMPGLVGWAPKTKFKGYHASNENPFIPDFFKEGWAQKTHNAPAGIYIANGKHPGYGFLTKRKYVHPVETTFEKPQIQLGEVKGRTKNGIRNQIERDAQEQGADGIIFKGIADNQMQNQFIAKTLNPDVKILPQRIRIGIPEEKIPTLSWNHATKLADNDKLIAAHNQFAQQYGYPELPYTLALSNRRINQAVRKTIARHNSFYRGVNPQMATKEDKLHYMESLKEGEQPTVKGFIKFAATTPRSEGAGIFVSPFSANSSIYGNGTTNLVRRPYKLGKDRMNWFKEGDFEVQSIYDSKKDLSGHPVVNPWEVIRYPFTPKPNNGTVPASELVLFNKLHYVGPRTYKATGETTNKTNVTLIHRKGGKL